MATEARRRPGELLRLDGLLFPEQMSPQEFYNARLDLGLTQAELARVLGCHEVTVIRYENGHREIPPGKANHLRLALARRSA